MSEGTNKYSAVDSTLGYLYQVRCALLWSLERLKVNPDFLVSIETLEDVAFETNSGDAGELLQLKHHKGGTASLTDASPDIWRTLRIWFEETDQTPTETNLFLVTTGKAPPGSAASYLRNDDNRDVDSALTRLTTTAQTSTNPKNEQGIAAFLQADEGQRLQLLRRVTVIDAAPLIDDIDGKLRQEIYLVAEKGFLTQFLERLEGWWFRRVVQQLMDSPIDRIGSVELDAYIDDLRDSFKKDALPIDDDLLDFDLDETTLQAHVGSTFVLQVDLAKAGKRRIAAAVRDFYRAYEQRSRWMREELVVGMELRKYETRLIEEWELVFEATRDELGDGASEDAKAKAARSILAWAERTNLTIRRNVTEPFVCRGSLHMLADEIRIGWHPDFDVRLAKLLTEVL